MSLVTFVYIPQFKVDNNQQPAHAVRFHNLGQNLNSNVLFSSFNIAVIVNIRVSDS